MPTESLSRFAARYGPARWRVDARFWDRHKRRDREKSDLDNSKDAVQTIGNQQFVFVAREQRMSSSAIGAARPETNGFYPVLEGASVGERIVTEGSFMLRAEWLKLHPSRQ